MTPRRLLSPLAVRLTAAFVAVALGAVAVLAVLTLVTARREVTALMRDTHRSDAQASATAAARAYQAAGGWSGADLTPAAAIAARGQANLTIRDETNQVIAAPSHEAAQMMAQMHGIAVVDVARGAPVTAPVVVAGRTVGSVDLRFPASHLPTEEQAVRDALSRNALLGAVLAMAAAAAAAVVIARRVTRPITALTDAAGRLEAGGREVRVDLADAPGELGALGAAFDRMAGALDEEDALRRRLVADVAHELRTPLAILQATTEALVDGVAEADDATLASLHEEVLRLTTLVADLETLAAADAARLGLDIGPVDLADVARSVVDVATPAADAADIALTAVLDPATAHGDERRLRQVLTTLVGNALAYTPTGGTIIVRTFVRGDDRVLEVADTGPGIDPDDLSHVFERFYRGHRTAGVAGSGVGLAVAEQLVAAHHGTITAANGPDRGAVFTVTLPSRLGDVASR